MLKIIFFCIFGNRNDSKVISTPDAILDLTSINVSWVCFTLLSIYNKAKPKTCNISNDLHGAFAPLLLLI